MAKCLRCGAGNEWIAPVQRESTPTAGAGYALVSRSTVMWAKAHVVKPPNLYLADVEALAELDRVLGPEGTPGA